MSKHIDKILLLFDIGKYSVMVEQFSDSKLTLLWLYICLKSVDNLLFAWMPVSGSNTASIILEKSVNISWGQKNDLI